MSSRNRKRTALKKKQDDLFSVQDLTDGYREWSRKHNRAPGGWRGGSEFSLNGDKALAPDGAGAEEIRLKRIEL